MENIYVKIASIFIKVYPSDMNIVFNSRHYKMNPNIVVMYRAYESAQTAMFDQLFKKSIGVRREYYRLRILKIRHNCLKRMGFL